MKHGVCPVNVRNMRWDARRLKLSFDYSRPGGWDIHPFARRWRLLVASYFALL